MEKPEEYEAEVPQRQMSVSEAERVVRLAQAQKMEQCRAAINAVLRQYGCDMTAEAYITPDGRTLARIRFQNLHVRVG